MQTKLILRLDDELIRKAKRYSRSTGRSLSQVVADFFCGLEAPADEDDLPPLVRSLKGALSGATQLDVDDYHHHLEEKHL